MVVVELLVVTVAFEFELVELFDDELPEEDVLEEIALLDESSGVVATMFITPLPTEVNRSLPPDATLLSIVEPEVKSKVKLALPTAKALKVMVANVPLPLYVVPPEAT